jgi:hypothetical protein
MSNFKLSYVRGDWKDTPLSPQPVVKHFESFNFLPRSFMPTIHTPSVKPSQAEQLIRISSAIASDLIKAHEAGQTVSLNEIRNKWSKKFNYGGVPRLVDIISAVPDEYKKALLPTLKARPIRTASGVGGSFLVLGSFQKIDPTKPYAR